ncbi:MAG: hypothetical protein K6F94_06770 [Bacteroidaceae bacterium]|nr:hypothetical protein [Bacteroidaceae bacterium]
MKRFLIFAAFVFITAASFSKSLTDGQEYFIVLDIYDKALGSSEDGSSPALSAISAKSDTADYIFVAEASGTSGYWLLRQKSTGRYLAASTSNSYSIVFQASKGTGDAYLWKASEGLKTYIRNKRNTNRRVGVDGAQKGADYVSIYFDKIQGSHSDFRIIPVAGSYSASLSNYVSEDYINSIGRKEVDYYQLSGDVRIERSDTVDIHITTSGSAMVGSGNKVILGSTGTWLIFDNITPSEVKSRYLSNVQINKSAASEGTNCRVAIYLNGAAVIPLKATVRPMEIYTEKNLGGQKYTVASGHHKTLAAKQTNSARSFILRRGNMATVYTNTQYGGYSRVYVADHSDLIVNELPTALDQRISSICIRPWQYVSKKGWCSTTSLSAIKTECDKVRATWFYTWSADRSSTDNLEYIPIRQHIYWPSMSTIRGFSENSGILSFNEPDHSEQHDDCDCGGVISAWTACTKTPEMATAGVRVGSPAPTDASWLSEYIGHVDDMAYRCDYVAFHAYWGTNEAVNVQSWYNQLKSIYNKTKRPIWITEWNNGASWTTESWPSSWSDKMEKNRKAIQEIIEMLDTCSFIERYSVYNWDTDYRAMINWSSGYVQPAGQVYRDNRSTFAYNASVQKVPNWWAPSAKTPSLAIEKNSSGKLDFTITNPNTDLTSTCVIERKGEDGVWQIIAEVTDRSKFDSQTILINNVASDGFDLDGDHFRVVVTTSTGKTLSSSAVDNNLITNGGIDATSKTSIQGWTCSMDAQNGYTKAGSGDTYFEAWDSNAAAMNFNYYQDIADLENGTYRLTANIFNTLNGVVGVELNDAVGLYAKTADQFYFAPVEEDDTLNLDRITTIDDILVTDGKLRVGVRNLGTMTGRWAGADNFRLFRTGDLPEDLARSALKSDYALLALMPTLGDADDSDTLSLPRDASRFIVNPDATRASNYGWTSSNVSFKTDSEAFDGVATNTYWNIWKSGAYNSSLKQTIEGLPEGDYTFSAVVRGSADVAPITIRIATAATATAEADSQTATFNGTGADTYPGSPYHQGWQRIETAPIHVSHGSSVELSFSVNTTASAWWSADHFGLTLVSSDAVTPVKAPYAVTENTMPLIYNLAGQRLATPHKGINIIDGRTKVIK